MKISILALSIATLLSVATYSQEVNAVSITAFTTDKTYSSIGLWVDDVRVYGWAFTTNAPVTITELGYFDSYQDGLQNSHDVGIWDSSGALLGWATVPSGTSAVLDGPFRFVPISPIALDADQTYIIGATIKGQFDDNYLRKADATNLEFDPSITFVEGRFKTFATGLDYPSEPETRDYVIHLDPNFKAEVIYPCEGDFNEDGDVDGSDLAVFAADFGRTDCAGGDNCEGDFDNDNDVDGSDLAVFASDFGRTDCP